MEWYGKNAKLRELVNLVVVGGDRRKESKDLEEQAEMKKMYSLIDRSYAFPVFPLHQLKGRWGLIFWT